MTSRSSRFTIAGSKVNNTKPPPQRKRCYSQTKMTSKKLYPTVMLDKDDDLSSEESNKSDADYTCEAEDQDLDDYKDPEVISDYKWEKVDNTPKKNWLPTFKLKSGSCRLNLDETSSQEVSSNYYFFSEDLSNG